MLLQGETMGQAQLILGYIGQVSACVVLVTPACTTLRDAWNTGTVGERSPLPFLAAIFNSGVWILCGRIAADKFVTWLNVIVASVQAVYFSYFLYKSTVAQRWRWMKYFCGAVIGYGCILCFYFAGLTSYFSMLCGASGVALAFIPLLNLPIAWRSVSMLSMPPLLPVPLASLINGVVLDRIRLVMPQGACFFRASQPGYTETEASCPLVLREPGFIGFLFLLHAASGFSSRGACSQQDAIVYVGARKGTNLILMLEVGGGLDVGLRSWNSMQLR